MLVPDCLEIEVWSAHNFLEEREISSMADSFGGIVEVWGKRCCKATRRIGVAILSEVGSADKALRRRAGDMLDGGHAMTLIFLQYT